MDRLLVAVVGNQNSGKSYTWKTLFDRTVRTGKKERTLSLGNGESVSVFLVSGSPEEREKYVGEIVQGDPRIVLCSMQYRADVFCSFRYFLDQEFFAFVHWLNPGYKASSDIATRDCLGLVPRLLVENSLIGIRNAKIDATNRGWARSRDLIRQSR